MRQNPFYNDKYGIFADNKRIVLFEYIYKGCDLMPKPQKRQSYLQGALILMMGTLIVKVVSLLFKMPITNMLSEAAMSYFENAYTFFTLFSTLATAGFPVAISKIVAEYRIDGRYRDTKKLLRLACTLFMVTGLACTLIMCFGAPVLANIVHNPGSVLSIMALSPAVFFLCMMGAFRGYYQGLQNMTPTATSQIIEAIVKLICGVLFTYVALNRCRAEFAASGTVLGKAYATQNAADLAIYQVGAAAALAGVVVSTAAGFLYLLLRHKFVGDGIGTEQLLDAPDPYSSRKVLRYIMQLGIPICIGSLTINLTSIIDMTTVMSRLSSCMEKAPDVVRAMYGSAIPADLENSLVPAHLYGAYTSIAMTISNIVPSATTGFGISALPLVSDAWARRSRRDVNKSVQMVLRITSLFAVPCGIGIWMLADPICRLFFSRPMGIAIAAPILRVLGIASIFISLNAVLNSLLQAIGRVGVPVRLAVIGGMVKLILNFIFVGVARINLQAVGYSTLACYVVMAVLGSYVVSCVAKVRINLLQILLKPSLAALACGFTAALAYDGISSVWASRFAVIPAVALGGVVYAAGVLLLKAVEKEDILMLPKGEKLAKILEKCSLIG